jgi:hypothetical protein
MKNPIATMALTTALVAPASALAQVPTTAPASPRPAAVPRDTRAPFTPAPNAGSSLTPKEAKAPADGQVQKSQVVPEATIVPGTGTVAAPTGPVDGYLLQPEHGPFMVVAETFRGPEAMKFALALAAELRSGYNLPAYVWQLRIKPFNSNIYGVPPVSPMTARNGDVPTPRAYDEAAVLVGNCPTTNDALKMLKDVKKIHPKCLEASGSLHFRRGAGLKYAYYTVNPLAAAQRIYPGREVRMHGGADFDPYAAVANLLRAKKKNDPMLAQMNSGSRSLYKCPGPYSLQVAEFTGRTSLEGQNHATEDKSLFKLSPLATAHDDAERLASDLTRKRSLKVYTPYVYHDRTSSRVLLGSFQGPDDPALARLKEALFTREMVEFASEKRVTLTPHLVLLGTSDGERIHDQMVQQASAAVQAAADPKAGLNVPELIPVPDKR